MDEQQIQHIQILQSINSICSLLVRGTQIEEKVAGLLFIAHDMLKHYWLDISIPSPTKKVLDLTDEIDLFLKGCAELD